MTPANLAMLLLAVALAATGQVILKHGMSLALIRAKETSSSLLIIAASSPWVVGGLAVFGASAVAWLLTLSRVPLTVAYPFNAIGYLGVLTAGVVVLHERSNAWTWLGTLMVIGGLVLVVTMAPTSG